MDTTSKHIKCDLVYQQQRGGTTHHPRKTNTLFTGRMGTFEANKTVCPNQQNKGRAHKKPPGFTETYHAMGGKP